MDIYHAREHLHDLANHLAFIKDTGRPPIQKTEDLGVMLHSIGYGQAGETYTWFDAALDNGVLVVPERGIELAEAATQLGRGA